MLGRAHLKPLQDAVGPAVEHNERVVLTARDDVPVIRQQRQHRAGVQSPALQQCWADFMGDGPGRKVTSEPLRDTPKLTPGSRAFVVYGKTLGQLPAPTPYLTNDLSFLSCSSLIQAS